VDVRGGGDVAGADLVPVVQSDPLATLVDIEPAIELLRPGSVAQLESIRLQDLALEGNCRMEASTNTFPDPLLQSNASTAPNLL
jgi:hypothetical protein